MPDAGAAGTLFNESVFAATHNSYSGDISGKRGTIEQQLESGVRFVEFDLFDTPWDTGDYQVGHLWAGEALWTEGSNPDTPDVSSWLGVVASWSTAHPGHAPIVVMVDPKGDFSNNPSMAAGNLELLNHRVLEAFGEERLFAAEELGESWPTTESLAGKVMVVLSGNAESRRGYLRDEGHSPAVAMDDSGRVIEVHDSGTGFLWYWTGQRGPDGVVAWKRHGQYDTGADPAVAMTNDGWIVEVHKSAVWSTLWCTVGKLGPDYEVTWQKAAQYDNGVSPTVRFDTAGGWTFREIHQSETTGKAWDWKATLDPGTASVAWGAHGQTSDAPFEEEQASSAAGVVSVLAEDDAPFSSVLRYTSNTGASGRIRYRQLLFVERQKSDAGDLASAGQVFAAAAADTGAGTASWVSEMQAAGRVVRLWQFGDKHSALVPNYPATDTPYADWYTAYCAEHGCMKE